MLDLLAYEIMVIVCMLMVLGLKWPDFNNEVIYAVNAISIYGSHFKEHASDYLCWKQMTVSMVYTVCVLWQATEMC